MLIASPVILIAAFGRLVRVKCPHCGHHKVVDRAPKQFRICPHCHKPYPDPLTKKAKK